ncbi:MAG: helix-turn-helix transcriptional regulator [Clostridia bacterium]|nr:helix-turn-helix transcriptional regulator [Clostridia bacterium]
MTDEEIFCNNIKRLREKHKLSKKEMAKKLGISTYSLRIIEEGRFPEKLTVDIFGYLMDEFKILPSEIFAES